jgi:hypothetical protein
LGAKSGEIRICCLFTPADQAKALRKIGIVSASDWLQRFEPRVLSDRFGFEITEDVDEWRNLERLNECREERRIERWEVYMQEHGSDMSTAAAKLKTHGAEIRALARQGLPRRLRAEFWRTFGGAVHLKATAGTDVTAVVDADADAVLAAELAADGRVLGAGQAARSTSIGDGEDTDDLTAAVDSGAGKTAGGTASGAENDAAAAAAAIPSAYAYQDLADMFMQNTDPSKKSTKVSKQISKDVDRSFLEGDNSIVNTATGRTALERVLGAYSLRDLQNGGKIGGYCQGMNFIVASLLLVFDLDEETTFWMLSSICENIFEIGYFTTGMDGMKIDLQVLSLLVEDCVPAVAQHLGVLEVPLELVASSWLMSLFTACLPAETLFRVWDILFCEGSEVLLMASVAMLTLLEPAIISAEDFGDVSRNLKGSKQLFDSDHFIATLVDLWDQLPEGHIRKLRAAGELASGTDPQKTANERCLLNTVKVMCCVSCVRIYN